MVKVLVWLRASSQVQNKPTFDVEDRSIRTYPILFEGATVSDVRRGDSVQPLP